MIEAQVSTGPLYEYEDAPRTPNADDPAIWVPRHGGKGLVIGVLKDGGLEVYRLDGTIVQAISPPNRMAIAADDPPAPGVQPEDGTGPCPESEDGETFGRFNNVDIVYGAKLHHAGDDECGGDGGDSGDGDWEEREVDLAVVTDRGCDRIRMYEIDPTHPAGPLIDRTAPDAPRVFDEPIDEQSTAYGIALHRGAGWDDDEITAYVSQRSRGVIAVLDLIATDDGHMTYAVRAELHAPVSFDVNGSAWTPCIDDPDVDPQFEGVAVDAENGILYAAQEVIGVWAIPLDDLEDDDFEGITTLSIDLLEDRTVSFGAPWTAVPVPDEEDEIECEIGDAPPGVGGEHLVADVEGVAIYRSDWDDGYVLVSSQGDGTIHVYDRDPDPDDAAPLADRHRGSFAVEGVDGTDGIDVVNVRLNNGFSKGLLVMHNGEAPPPADESPINGYDYAESTQFVFVRWSDVANAFEPRLKIRPNGWNPRD